MKVDTADVRSMAQATRGLGEDVRTIRSQLSGGASAPTSAKVSGEAAGSYSQTLDEWLAALDQLATSLDNMAQKLDISATLYDQTELNATISAK